MNLFQKSERPVQVRLPAGQQVDHGLGPGGEGALPRQAVPRVRHEPGPRLQDVREPVSES